MLSKIFGSPDNSDMKVPPGLDRVQRRISDIIQRMEKIEGRSTVGTQTKTETPVAGETRQADSRPEPRTELNPPAAGQKHGVGTPTFSHRLEDLIQKHGAKHGVSPDLIRAVIKAESGGKVNARSKAGALGLMQLMPGTAKDLGVNPLNASQNIDGGTRYLKQMAGRFNSLDEVLAAYNAGPGAVRKYGGVPPYPETKQYIRNVRGFLPGRRLDISR